MIEMQSVAKVVLVCGSGIAPTAIRSLLNSSEPGWSSGPESDSSRCVPMGSPMRYAASVEQPAIWSGSEQFVGWLSDLWDSVKTAPAFWTIVGFVVSGMVQFVSNSRLSTTQENRATAREQRVELQRTKDCRIQFQRDTIVELMGAVSTMHSLYGGTRSNRSISFRRRERTTADADCRVSQ
jgi:hypothetical protein